MDAFRKKFSFSQMEPSRAFALDQEVIFYGKEKSIFYFFNL